MTPMPLSMYEEIDKKIVSLISLGANQFYRINASLGDLAAEIAGPGRSSYRVIDMRLQSLKKRGLIRFKAGKWEVCK